MYVPRMGRILSIQEYTVWTTVYRRVYSIKNLVYKSLQNYVRICKIVGMENAWTGIYKSVEHGKVGYTRDYRDMQEYTTWKRLGTQEITRICKSIQHGGT